MMTRLDEPRASCVRQSIATFGLAAFLASLAACTGISEGSLEQEVTFGPNPGNLTLVEYVPAGLAAGAPLVVPMHGCTQTASEYYRNAGWEKLANAYGFALAMPEQKTANNSNRCFNWFESGDNRRGQGEAQSIASMVDAMVQTYNLDSSRVFVTGLSAGGAMTEVMLATYPEKFAGGAVMAGIPYGCAQSMTQGFSCMSGVNKSPAEWGNAVRGASSYSGPWPTVSIWHGTADYTVATMNLTESLEQWTDVHGIDRTADATSTVGNATRSEYRNSSGTVLVETWSISGMGHATAVDPGSAPEQCGTTGTYFVDANVCSSYHAAERWGIIGTGGGSDGGSDGGVGDGGAGDGGGNNDGGTGDGGTGGHVCTQYTANNYQHVQAGRAYQTLGYVYAVGSNDPMGLYNVFGTKTLAQTAPGYYKVGSCP